MSNGEEQTGRVAGIAIVDAIVAMAKGLRLNLIAEGVETMPQLEYLR